MEVSISAPIVIINNYRPKEKTRKSYTYPNRDVFYKEDTRKANEIREFIERCKAASGKKITNEPQSRMRRYIDDVYESMAEHFVQ